MGDLAGVAGGGVPYTHDALTCPLMACITTACLTPPYCAPP